ncbi:MAG TPA: protein-glutamine glutaminase family protein [Bacteriovoracaceae bacterium]|nr:protein-glutamine glutaminase family protein [Bacteriovoracaceae bacterium]
MKVVPFLAVLFSFSAFAQTITLKDYDYPVTDIASKNLSTEGLFSSMNRSFIDVGSSICSNRALMWANDFKRNYGLNTAKIFVFFTSINGRSANKSWWYHVSPMVNDRGNMVVMDAGFSDMIEGPLSIGDWLVEFTGTSNCKEIKADETDLIEKMYRTMQFPIRTSYGSNDCYYRIAPAGNWTPESVAKQILGKDASGTPVRYERNEIDQEELFTACLESTSSSLGRFFGNGKKKCKKYISSGY